MTSGTPASTDAVAATHQFDVADDKTYPVVQDISQTTRKPPPLRPTSKCLIRQETFYNNTNYDPSQDFNDDSDEMPATGAKNGLRLADMRGADTTMLIGRSCLTS